MSDGKTKYQLINGDLYYMSPSINYGIYMISGMEYNCVKELDFTLYIPPTDWSKVEVDTKVLVSDNGEYWHKRHFAKYENDKIYTWSAGCTSFTYDWDEEELEEEESILSWKYAKLYEEER